MLQALSNTLDAIGKAIIVSRRLDVARLARDQGYRLDIVAYLGNRPAAPQTQAPAAPQTQAPADNHDLPKAA